MAMSSLVPKIFAVGGHRNKSWCGTKKNWSFQSHELLLDRLGRRGFEKSL